MTETGNLHNLRLFLDLRFNVSLLELLGCKTFPTNYYTHRFIFRVSLIASKVVQIFHLQAQ